MKIPLLKKADSQLIQKSLLLFGRVILQKPFIFGRREAAVPKIDSINYYKSPALGQWIVKL